MITQRYNAETILNEFPALNNLSELFGAIEQKTLEGGQVVCQFRVNGMNFSENDEKKAQEMAIKDIEFVEILVDTPMNLLASVIQNWIEDLPRLIERSDLLASGIREKGLEANYTPFVRLIDDCQFLTDSLLSIRTFPIAAEFVGRPEWEEGEKAMAKSVGESLQSFEKKDSNWLADVIEYDLASCLQNWHGLLGGLHGKISGSTAITTDSPVLTENA